MSEARKGILLVISGPSGVGKGTLIKRLMAADKTLVFSVSATTRDPRPGETDGKDYHFVTNERFDRLVAENAFVEWANVHTARYGTLRSEVYERLNRGENVVLDIDVQGAMNVIGSGEECVSIFIVPPSMAELRRRLEGRGTETPEKIAVRLNNARHEIPMKDRYDFVVINDTEEAATARLAAIIEAMKHSGRYYTVEVPEE